MRPPRSSGGKGSLSPGLGLPCPVVAGCLFSILTSGFPLTRAGLNGFCAPAWVVLVESLHPHPSPFSISHPFPVHAQPRPPFPLVSALALPPCFSHTVDRALSKWPCHTLALNH